CSPTQRAVDSTNVTVTWSPLPCADHYDVEYALSHKDGCEQINSLMYDQHCTCRESQTTVNGLMPNSQYVVQIKAYVNGAYGPPATTQITTTSAAPTGPPTLVTTESIGQRNLTFTWSSPSCGDRGGTLTEYVYELSSPNTGWKTSAPISAEEVTINELLPFTNYSFRVIAKNSVGNGPFSEAVTARTLEAEPTVPLNVHIQSVDNVSVILRWSEPDPPRGVITHYNVRYWKSAQTDTMETTADVMGLMHRVAGLEASSTYLFQVQATTSAGAGPWSEAINTTTAIGVPGPIRNLTYTERTETSITLSWNPPLEPRGPILGYIVEYRILESPQPHLPAENAYHSSEVQGSPFLQNNLNSGTKYEFRVVARNGMFQGTHDEVLVVYTKPLDQRIPPRPTLHQAETTDTTVTISFVALGSEKRIESHVIHVKRLGVLSVNKRDVLVPGSYEDPASGYITAKFLKNNLPEIFVVGDSKMYDGYWNAPLQRDAVYNIRVGSLTQVNEREVNVTYSEPLTVTVQPSEPAENQNAAIITAAVLGPISLVLTLTVVITCVIWRRRSLKSTSNDSLLPGTVEMMVKPSAHSPESAGADNRDSVIYEDTVLPSGTQKMDIKWKNLIVEDVVLGKGNFGEVRAGGVRVKGEVTKAAIKTLKDGASDSAVKDFKEEMQTMANIKPHRNIVSLLGACYHEGILHVALEYLPNGNLRDYLRRNRPKQEQGKEQNTETSHLTSLNLLTFGADVATGMDHLSKTGIIHRDLAARNILLAEDLTAKVSDFGLSRGEDIYVQKSSTRIPVRWLAIESLTRRIYKSKSDVWSFGILLWEIATYGSTPYPGIESKSLAQRLLDGYRMPKPENCTDDIYNLMLECWQEIPSRRPTFKEINEVLEDMSAHSNEQIYMSPTIYENFIIKKEFDDN
ncbi:angiopoietin-1 receptor-like, partial [Acanthaster planci]|uniref:receptor protein-tyrosine kinase n=1 Tax=Acanthaster planci TaxID=133434 RepID=A0A8B8A6L1_ACAPL